jgi:hypothetical protein
MSVVYAGVPERNFDEVIHERFDAKSRFFYPSY